MSARFWLFSLACSGAALTGGLGLGVYATTPQKLPWAETVLPEATIHQDAYDPAELTGPAIVKCSGCGPTLADRQMATDMAGWDASNDPMWHDYNSQPNYEQANYDAEPEAPAAQPLPVSVERYATEGSTQPWPVKVAQAPAPDDQSTTPAGVAPTDAALSF
ncbi:hypothetical protein [Sphingobium bisphenolivorans]|uniref:hypothetical protein n=1 Tax=Sphingobium bisphenolivorans TaxID=1335760 RepID=UPI0003A928A4|nr:hypothetical protein [Sphingobium bisphenolivorans]